MADPMLNKLKHHWNVSSRREFFTQAGSGLAGIALAAMLAEEGYAATDPLAPKKPQTVSRPLPVHPSTGQGAPARAAAR